MLNQAMEISTGVLLAAGMAATGVVTKLSTAYVAMPTSGTGLFAKVFPYTTRVSTQLTAKVGAEIARTSTRAVAGVVRAGAARLWSAR